MNDNDTPAASEPAPPAPPVAPPPPVPAESGPDATADDADARTLAAMGYRQELARVMGGFSNFAVSLSIICILAGGVTSFHLGFCSVGGAAIGIGWPVSCALSLVVAAAMAQIASAFPTAGGLYHWASILGGRGWGWATAWFNLLGLVTVLAAINAGTYDFAAGVIGWKPPEEHADAVRLGILAAITASHAAFNHLGIRLTSRLTDLSGYLILIVSVALTVAFLACIPASAPWDWARLWTFENFSGLPAGEEPVWPATGSLPMLFCLGLLLPAYTITGFDASAHASEETHDAATNAPPGIVRSVLVSAGFGWAMLCAAVLAMPDPRAAAEAGSGAFAATMDAVIPAVPRTVLYAGIIAAQYLCGLATVTAASRMAYAFARDGGLPFSAALRRVSPRTKAPAAAVWAVAAASVAFTVYTPVYATLTAACTIFLYISYVLPTALGLFAHGRTWREMGPWHLGSLFKPAAAVSVLFTAFLIVIGVQPPNDKNLYVVAGAVLLGAVVWFGWERRRFPGPPALRTGGKAGSETGSP